jgi:spore coat polysaccharide biosynthesis protein SpsF (cytidylyltransferase family)
MLKTLGIVQACFHDATTRAKALRRLRGKTVLERVVRRVTDSLRLGGVIVVTDDDPSNRLVAELVPLDVPVYVGRQADNLGRVAGALEAYRTEAAVLVRCDSPFIDPGLIDRLVTVAEADTECDYASYRSRSGLPAIHSPVGVYAEWFRVAALRRAARLATDPADRRAVTSFLSSRPETFRTRLIPAPEKIDQDDVRLAVDIEEDWEHALAIFDALGSDEFDWQRIADLLAHQPTMRERMRDLNRALAAG